MTDTAAVTVPGTLNFRDVGGLRAGARATREGVLYRSGNLARLDDGGRAAFRALGIRRIIDLRADDEVALEPSRVAGLDVETVRMPMLLGSAASLFERDIDIDAFYREMVDETADRIVDVVRALLVAQPVLVHCTVGKDRTGVAVALALAAVGVDEDAIVTDYARTEGMLPQRRTASVLAYIRAHHPAAVHLEELAARSPAAAMRALLDGLRERYGAPVEFLRAHGLADDEIAELCRVLVTS